MVTAAVAAVVGAAVGAVFGVVSGDLVLWPAVGAGLGVGWALAFGKRS